VGRIVAVGKKIGLTAAAVSIGVMLVGGGALAWKRPWEAGSSTSAGRPTASPGPSSGSVPSPSATSSAAAEPAAPTWLSGASSDESADGRYGTWRGEPIQIGGTWDNGDVEQVEMHSICPDGSWATWNKPLDVAIGAIDVNRGESWAAAARGAYTARWTKNLTKMKQCWGKRDPSMLYIRFAHEMNIPSDWRVRGGEEASFVKAIKIYSDLRYQILPQAKIVLCPNDGTDGGHGLDIRKLWPGKDAQGRQVANVYAVDSYNMDPHVTSQAEFIKKINGQYPNGIPLGIEKHRQFAARMGVPFAIGEWSNNGDRGHQGGGGESALYVRQFYAWAKSHAGDPAAPKPGQLLYEVQFNLWGQYAFWPKTIQPKTAAAYRALTWGR
jgi:hypothetical protein